MDYLSLTHELNFHGPTAQTSVQILCTSLSVFGSLLFMLLTMKKLCEGLVWFGLCCLMTPGLSKDIRCHV